MTKTTLLENIHTREELQTTLNQVDAVLVSIFQTEKTGKVLSLGEILEKVAGVKMSQIVKAEIEDQKINVDDTFALKTYFEKLRTELAQVKIFQVTLAIDPGFNLVREISNWVHKNVDPDVILDIAVDSSLLGGATIIYGGKYYNNSLRNIIEQTLSKSKQNILKDIAVTPRTDHVV